MTKYSEEGTYLWSQVITGDSTEELRDLSVAPDGATWVVGHFQGDIDFGKGEVESKGNQDAFMLKYSP